MPNENMTQWQQPNATRTAAAAQAGPNTPTHHHDQDDAKPGGAVAPSFRKAVKQDAKLRLATCGPSGSGKTFTLLKIASELGGPVAVIDTERGSASKYAD